MTDKDTNGWQEYRKFVVEELTRNRQMHDLLFEEISKLREQTTKRNCIEREEFREVEIRIAEVEKTVENFKGRLFMLAAGIGIAGALVGRIFTFVFEHGPVIRP